MARNILILGDRPMPGDSEGKLKDAHGRYLWHLFLSQSPPRTISVAWLFDSNGKNQWRKIKKEYEPDVVLALGEKVAKELLIDGSIMKTRGSVYEFPRKGKEPLRVVPTFHPSELKLPYRTFSEDKLERGFYTASDVRRVINIARYGWERPTENYNLKPTLKDVEKFVNDAIENQWELGCDLEATGLDIENVEIVVMGFAWSESDAIIVPLLTDKGADYWSQDEKPIVTKLLRKLFKHGKFLFQNGVGYDIPLLRARGWNFDLQTFVGDTMIKHHSISPELPHNIGFISSFYGKIPYWKNSFLSRKEHIFYTDQIKMREYCARDCCALLQIDNEMTKHIKQLETSQPEYFGNLSNIYQNAMEDARVVIEMYEAGVTLDKKREREWQKTLDKELGDLIAKLENSWDLPPSFNWNSDAHIRYLLYHEKIPALDKIDLDEELQKYEEEAYNYQYECSICGRKVTKKYYTSEIVPKSRTQKCPKCNTEQIVTRTEKPRTSVRGKSKETKKYLELKQLEELAKMKPLPLLRNYRPLTTNTGKSALDKAAIVRYAQHIDNRVNQIHELKRRSERHETELEELKVVRNFLTLLMNYSKISKLHSSFYSFPVWRDGKVRPHVLVTGTATGRYSYNSPNLQQVPSGEVGEKLRAVFKASNGTKLVSVDFSNLEVQIGARIFNDTALIEMLENGINMHDENTKIFFGIAPDHPKWNTLRKVSKTIMFGRLLYGGTDAGIYSKVITAFPDSGLLLNDFKQAVENYFKAHPDFQEWVDKVQRIAVEDRVSINAFGRVRSLLSDKASIKRQALNTPVQGSAADAVREDMRLLSRAFKENNLKTKILLQIHDELLFEIPDNELKEAGKIIHSIMNRERTVNGHTFKIPIDAEIGRYWGTMNGYDLLTGEVTGGTKH